MYDYLLCEAVGAFILFLQSEHHAANSNNQNTRENHHFKKRDFTFQLKYFFVFNFFHLLPHLTDSVRCLCIENIIIFILLLEHSIFYVKEISSSFYLFHFIK